MTGFLERLLFDHRRACLVVFGLLSLVMAWQASRIRIDAGFEKLLPLEHPYIRTFLEYADGFGGANRLLIAVRAREGDIFTPEVFRAVESVTDSVFFLPGVNRSTVTSITTPNVRFIEIVEGGFTGGNVVWADFTPTPENLARVRENVLKSGTVGRLVANDFSAAMITAELVEIDPATGERLDVLGVARRLESSIREPHVNDAVDVHIVGFAKMVGDVAAGAAGVVAFFLVAVVITILLVYLFTRSRRLTLFPVLTSVVAVVWALGLLSLLGFGLDPMSLLVPFLIFAIGASHGVQMMNAVGAEIHRGADCEEAARAAFRKLVVPGGIALVSDTVGFLTLLLIDIGIIRELAITASLGVMVILVTNLGLLPVLLSFGSMSEVYRDRIRRSAARRERFWRSLARFAEPRTARIALGAALVLGLAAAWAGRDPIVGDTQVGVPELRPDSRYNRDTAVITGSFSIGLDLLTTLVETVPDGCVEYDVMTAIDDFAWRIGRVEGVQSTLSLPQVARVINAGWNEGHPAWRVIPRNPATLAQSVSQVETSTGLLNSDCSVMPVIAFLEDHKAETIDRVVAEIEAHAAEHDGDRHRFRLATGNVGVMAATNQVVRRAQLPMLLWIYAAVIALCVVTFRSWRAAACIVLPLSLVSVLTYGLMNLLGIGLKTYTLPVAALGVGIGVDYGIYIYSRLRAALDEGLPLEKAYLRTLRVTGSAVIITGLTLAAGTSTWILSDLQFQADMGLLLTFMFLANMLGAALLLPGLARFLLPEGRRAPDAG